MTRLYSVHGAKPDFSLCWSGAPYGYQLRSEFEASTGATWPLNVGQVYTLPAPRTTTGSPDFVIPWVNLAITAVVVPLLAVLVAAVFTPSRLPLVRRAT